MTKGGCIKNNIIFILISNVSVNIFKKITFIFDLPHAFEDIFLDLIT